MNFDEYFFPIYIQINIPKAGGKVAPAPFVIVGAEVGAATALAFSRIHPELVHQESDINRSSLSVSRIKY